MDKQRTISEELLSMACSKGLCKPFREAWKEQDKHDLVEVFKANPDWCLERGFPDLAFLKEHFDNKEQQAQGVYIDKDVMDLILTDQVYMFINCTGECRVSFDRSKAIFPMIYVSMGSYMKFVIEDSNTPIQLYDDSYVDVSTIGTGKCTVYNYGKGSVSYPENTNIKVIKKNG
ncbi:hypothetical protein PF672P2_00007 [Parabacteroides phage PF672P2]|nr:hypothetical protein PF672P2_00007 [Parabacteroides phage PF672P2]